MVRIDDSVITAQLLESRLGNERAVEICPRATLTPSAQDYIRTHNVQVLRRQAGGAAPASAPATPAAGTSRGGRREFKGIFCPNIVIFDAQGRINRSEMERYVEWLIQAGIHGLYPNGSTGEFVRLSVEERKEVVRIIVDVNQGRVPILAGASEANLRDVLDMAEFYAGIGVDAISLVPPYYYKISERSLYEHFAEIARHSPLDKGGRVPRARCSPHRLSESQTRSGATRAQAARSLGQAGAAIS